MNCSFNLRLLVVPAIASLALLFAACGNDDDSNGNGNPNGDNGNTSDAVSEITIDMGDNWFEPDNFTVQAGTVVTVTVDNVGQAVHNMVIQSQEAEGENFASEAMVSPGESDTFEFTFTTPGTYDFQCDYHLPEMVGEIIVVE